jgi:autotransporter adhesin
MKKVIIAVSFSIFATSVGAFDKTLEQVDNEDMRVKSGYVDGDNLVLRVEDQKKSNGRNNIYGKDVTIDVATLKGSKGDQGERGVDGVVDEETKQTINNNTSRSTVNKTNIERFDASQYGIYENTNSIDTIRNDMQTMDRNLSAGIASAIAMSQHQFDPRFNGGQVSIAGGVYNGENAVSIAVGVPLGNRAFFNASASANSGSGSESLGMGVTILLP